MFGGKELQDEIVGSNSFEVYDFGARNYDAALGRWMNVDPLAEERSWVSPYNFVQNNPITRVDPNGALDEPIYDESGNHLGNTKEGFTGQVLIYSGDEDVDFSKMSADEAMTMDGVDTYDNQRGDLSGDAKSNIWTHIASKLEGTQIYDETFSISSIEGGKIHFDNSLNNSWESEAKSIYPLWNDKITGSDKYSYSTTVENIQSSVVVHEWYSHIKKGNGDFRYDIVNGNRVDIPINSHRLAYKNVINFKSLWNKTTAGFKGFNMRRLKEYTIDESNGRKTQVNPLYRNLYNKYHKKYD